MGRGRGTWDARTRGLRDVGLGDAGTRGRGDVGTRGRGDVGTWGRGDVGTWGRGDVGTWDLGLGNAGDAGTWDAGLGDVINKQHLIFSLNLLITIFDALEKGINYAGEFVSSLVADDFQRPWFGLICLLGYATVKAPTGT